jgi:hypothetical protein
MIKEWTMQYIVNLIKKKEQLKRVELLCLQTCHPPIGSKLKQKIWY